MLHTAKGCLQSALNMDVPHPCLAWDAAACARTVRTALSMNTPWDAHCAASHSCLSHTLFQNVCTTTYTSADTWVPSLSRKKESSGQTLQPALHCSLFNLAKHGVEQRTLAGRGGWERRSRTHAADCNRTNCNPVGLPQQGLSLCCVKRRAAPFPDRRGWARHSRSRPTAHGTCSVGWTAPAARAAQKS